MPLNQHQVDEFSERYWRERDRFMKFAQSAGELCRQMVMENAVRASVHWRAKTKESARRKLQQKYQAKLGSVDEAFARIKDLAAVRILTYVEEDRQRVVNLIEEVFSPPVGRDEIAVDLEDKVDNENRYAFYRATHCEVALPDDHLIGENENLRGMSCEIQVCSMLAHVWNELEHDLIYKPQSGQTSREEKEFLRILGNQTLAGDGVISEILRATTARQREENEDFVDQYDFVSRVRPKFPGVAKFYKRSEQAFNALRDLGILNPASLSERILDQYKEPEREARELIQRINDVHGDDWSPAHGGLEEDSADAVLVLIARNFGDRLLKMYPGGRGMGRPPRVAHLARLLDEL